MCVSVDANTRRNACVSVRLCMSAVLLCRLLLCADLLLVVLKVTLVFFLRSYLIQDPKLTTQHCMVLAQLNKSHSQLRICEMPNRTCFATTSHAISE